MKATYKNRSTHVVVIGYSRGSEAALLAAGIDHDIDGVAVFSPSSVVWGAMGNNDLKGPSGWSYNGKPLPFLVPSEKQTGAAAFESVLNDTISIKPSLIHSENIQGPIILMGSDDDAIWPSGRMARMIQKNLQSKNYSYPVTLMIFNHASHRILGSGQSSPTETYKSPDFTRIINFGGTAEGTKDARNTCWAALQQFLKNRESDDVIR